MDKKIAGLLGAVAALGTVTPSEAALISPPSEALRASTYADLLAPIPNAGAILRAMDEQQGADRSQAVQLAQYHHHHHHHRTVVITRHRTTVRHHHHHHHHHHHD